MTNQELIAKAKEAMTKAYAPYSHFQVGAALLAKDGRVFTGCNGKRHLWGDRCERTAVTKAVSEGVREFEKIAIVASSGDYAAPCGICRQVLFEFMPEGKVVLWSELEGEKEFALTELLPFGFRGEDIK
ncbi:MAG: cytidine deaminase [Anaerotignum sp.]|uniref:cytidine deaminase n=1 Tax=Anaerotignum sp. TaxID=2039241 RepID=UPI003992EB55